MAVVVVVVGIGAVVAAAVVDVVAAFGWCERLVAEHVEQPAIDSDNCSLLRDEILRAAHVLSTDLVTEHVEQPRAQRPRPVRRGGGPAAEREIEVLEVWRRVTRSTEGVWRPQSHAQCDSRGEIDPSLM